MRPMPLPRSLDLGLALRRRPRLRSALSAAMAVACGLAVFATLERAEGARRAWGDGVPVLVAVGDLAPGTRLDASNTRVALLPQPLVPAGALSDLPRDGRLVEAVYEGETIRSERLAARALSAVAARLPAGTRAMAIPMEAGLVPALTIGDRVDVLVAVPAEAAAGGPPGFALAEAVLVVDVTEQAVTVAVPRDLAPRLAVAFGQGAVSLALVGG